MAFKNLESIRKYSDRRAMRRAAVGIELEDTVEQILFKMQSSGKILRFIRHPHNSPEDYSGKDFTVFFSGEAARSFGVTISNRSWQRGKIIHCNVTQFFWPIGTNKETMEKRIMGLLDKAWSALYYPACISCGLFYFPNFC